MFRVLRVCFLFCWILCFLVGKKTNIDRWNAKNWSFFVGRCLFESLELDVEIVE